MTIAHIMSFDHGAHTHNHTQMDGWMDRQKDINR